MGSALLGILYGGIGGALLIVLAFVAGAFTEGNSLVQALPIAGAIGLVSGAMIAVVAALTESVPVAVAMAVIVEGVFRLLVLNLAGLWWGLTAGGIMITLAVAIGLGWFIGWRVLASIEHVDAG